MSTTSTLAARSRRLFAATAAVLVLLASSLVGTGAAAQGGPDILWSAPGHSGAVTAIALSPDGTVMATSSDDATLKLWRYPQGTLLRTLALPYDITKQVTGIARVRFTPDGRQVAAAVNFFDAHTRGTFGAVHVFRVSDGARVRTLARQRKGIASIDVSPDGRRLASAGQRRGVVIWRMADGSRVESLAGRPGPASEVHFSPSGDRLCAGYDDHHLVMFATSGWSAQWDVEAHADGIEHLEFSPDGERVATASRDGTAKLFDAADGSLLHTLPVGFALYAASFAPDGGSLATAGLDGAIRLWDVAGGSLIRQFAHGGEIVSLRFAGDGAALISGGNVPARIAVWNPADGSRLRTLARIASPIGKVVFSADSKSVAIAAPYDDEVSVFDAANGRRRYAWNTHAEVDEVAISPDSRLVAMAGPDNTVVVRRLSDGRKIRTLVGHEERVVGLGFSHDGRLLATGSFFPGTIRLWSTSDWSLVREIEGGTDLGAFGPFVSFSFSPDDTLLGTVGEGAPIVVRVADGRRVAMPAGLSRAASFSPDGRLFVVSGSVDLDEVRIYRVSDWTLSATLPTGANDVAFTPDGTGLFAGQMDALRLWRTADWTIATTYDQELGYTGSGQGLQTIAVSPDGRRFAYGRYDATLVVARNPR